jgi:CDP-glucose 4,6-dehydratase
LVLALLELGNTVSVFGHSPRNKNTLGQGVLHLNQLDKTSVIGDLENLTELQEWIKNFEPEIIFHFGSRALVSEAKSNPIDFLLANSNGTVNLFKAIQNLGISNINLAIATTDKVYERSNLAHRENDRLWGSEPYSMSKVSQEIIVEVAKKFCDSKNIGVLTLRSGNLIGGGDRSPGRLVPDLVAGWMTNSTVEIRNPQAVRPWQHVVEVAEKYIYLMDLMITRKISKEDRTVNVGPNSEDMSLTVSEVISHLQPDISPIVQTTASAYNEDPFLQIDTHRQDRLLGTSRRIETIGRFALIKDWEKRVSSGEDPVQVTRMQIRDWFGMEPINES